MDVLFDLVIGLGVIGGVYYWVKTKLLKPDIPRDMEIFPSRGVPLVKRNLEQQATVETESAKIAVVEQVEQVEQVESSSLQANEPAQTVSEPVVEALMAESEHANIQPLPEDSVLKRHYLTQRAAERHAITNPYPTDSVLRRHFESALAATFAPAKQVTRATEVESVETTGSGVAIASSTQIETPQDSVLKRHYQQLLESKLAENLA